MTPDLCPECRKVGVVATVNGPTCQHQEIERVEWLWANRTKNFGAK